MLLMVNAEVYPAEPISGSACQQMIAGESVVTRYCLCNLAEVKLWFSRSGFNVVVAACASSAGAF